MVDILAGLTEPQRQAVMHRDGPLLVLAGPGSGKTRVVTHRVAQLIREGVPAQRLVALTFTNKSAGEMQRRVAELVPGSQVFISTFHRFCARLLRRYATFVGLEPNFTIYDTSDSLSALSAAFSELDLDPRASLGFSPEQIMAALSRAKNNLVPLEPRALGRFLSAPLDSAVARIGPVYQGRLLASNAVDFDDLLRHTALLLADNPEVRARLDQQYGWILVDEYQDTNKSQYAIVRALSLDLPNLAVTGDPDQSIYSWRGASVQNILQFEADYPHCRVVRLEQNYRSTPKILSAADHLITFNVHRKHKRLFTENADVNPVRLTYYENYQDEARAIAAEAAAEAASGRSLREIAVFYRTNALSRVFESALREAGVPYQVINAVEFFQRKEIKDLLAYLHLLHNPRNDVAFERIVNVPPRGLGKKTLEHLRELAKVRGRTRLEAARSAAGEARFSRRAQASLQAFVELIDRLGAPTTESVVDVLRVVLTETGYAVYLAQAALEEDVDRMANVDELLTAAEEYDNQIGQGLEGFLEDKSLVADVDALSNVSDSVSLMTLHSSKGLEFRLVYVVGIEQGLLPHERSRTDPLQLEEERRLLFVGMTRAKECLRLSHARYRGMHGMQRMAVPSEFLMQLPRDEMEMCDRTQSHRKGRWHAALDDGDASNADSFDEGLDSWLSESGHDPPVYRHSASGPAESPPLRLTTAAEWMATPPHLARLAPEQFALQMIVQHPEHGLGKIIALEGQGGARKARVRFASAAGERTFVLIHSALAPVGSNSTGETP